MIKTRKGFIIRKISEAYMILAIGSAGEQFRDILQTNETGSFYWSQLEKGTTIDAMVKASTERFDDLDEKTAREDILEFLDNVRDAVEEV